MNSAALCFLILIFVPLGGKNVVVSAAVITATALCQPDKSSYSYESEESSSSSVSSPLSLFSNKSCKICNSFFDYLLCYRNSSLKIIKPHQINRNFLLNSDETSNDENNNYNNINNNNIINTDNENEITSIEKPLYAQKRSHSKCSCVSKQNFTEMDNDTFPRQILTHTCDPSKCALNTHCSPTIYKVNVLRRLKYSREKSIWMPKELRNEWTFEKVSIIADCICQPNPPGVIYSN